MTENKSNKAVDNYWPNRLRVNQLFKTNAATLSVRTKMDNSMFTSSKSLTIRTFALSIIIDRKGTDSKIVKTTVQTDMLKEFNHGE